MNIFAEYFLYFYLYSLLGWATEVIFCSIGKRKFENRGFLFQPICPIYGFGALLIIVALIPIKEHWYLVFLIGMIGTSAIEYVTSFVLEKMFHMNWWDYSHKKFNLHGRICLKNSVLFGLLGLTVVYLLHPGVVEILSYLRGRDKIIIAFSLLVVVSLDLIFTLAQLLDFKTIIHKYRLVIVEKVQNLLQQNQEKEESRLKKYLKRYQHRFPRLQYRSKDKDENLFERITNFIKNRKKEDE